MIKVGVVGTGFVGSSYAYSLVTQGIANELVLIDKNEELAAANALDIIHGTNFLPTQPKIYAGKYEDLKNADVVCITSGANTKPGQSRLEVANINRKIMIEVVNNIKLSGFDGILLIASNPVDVLTYVVINELGWDKSRVIGSGTVLDTSRFKSNLSQYFNFNSSQVHANIIGEHGDSSVPVISTARIGNKSIYEVIRQSKGKYTLDGVAKCYEEARDAAYTIIEGKGATYYGIGTALTKITRAIVNNENMILTVSTLLQGEYDGISDVVLSVPCIINRDGIREIFFNQLSEDEIIKLHNSADKIRESIEQIQEEA